MAYLPLVKKKKKIQKCMISQEKLILPSTSYVWMEHLEHDGCEGDVVLPASSPPGSRHWVLALSSGLGHVYIHARAPACYLHMGSLQQFNRPEHEPHSLPPTVWFSCELTLFSLQMALPLSLQCEKKISSNPGFLREANTH